MRHTASIIITTAVGGTLWFGAAAVRDASAEAGLYVARGEAHWANDHGTSAQAEGYIGAQGEATAGAQIGPGGARVEAGRLLRLLPDWTPPFGGFYLYHPSARQMPKQLRAFIDFLSGRLAG